MGKYCGKCGTEMPYDVEFCENCGKKFQKPKKLKMIVVAVIIIAVVVALFLFVLFQPDEGKFVGVWELETGMGVGPGYTYYMIFYENGSVQTASSYNSDWGTYWLEDEKLYIAPPGQGSDQTPGYDYEFSEFNNHLEISLGGTNVATLQKVDIDPEEIIPGGSEYVGPPTISYTKQDTIHEESLTIVMVDPNDLEWENITMLVNGETTYTHGLSGTIEPGDKINLTQRVPIDEITTDYTVSFVHIPTNYLIATFDFIRT